MKWFSNGLSRFFARSLTRLSRSVIHRSSRYRRPLLIGVFLVSVFTCWGIGEWGRYPASVSALEPAQAQQVAILNPWNGASFPVENFQAYTSPFGYRRDPYGGGQRFHYGLDLAAPSGSYIRSWWAGKVVEVSDNTSCGTSVTIQSGEWQHIYCHMHGHVTEDGNGRVLVDRDGGIQIWQGQDISSGARIGRVGMTGRTTGPHLHWGLKYQSNWVDPALVLRAMYNSQRAALSQP